MITIILTMLFGIALGYLFREKKATQKAEKTVFLTILALLFILGLSIGSNDAIINNVFSYGKQAAILASFSFMGSVLMSWFIYKLFFGKGGEQ